MGERKRRRWVAFEVIEVVEESKLSMLDTVLVWCCQTNQELENQGLCRVECMCVHMYDIFTGEQQTLDEKRVHALEQRK